MPKVSTTIRTDSVAKREAQQIFSKLGLDMSTAVNIYFYQVIRNQGLPFEIILDKPNAVTKAAMDIAQTEKDKYGPFDNANQVMESLNTKK